MKGITILSGGMDSATLAYFNADRGIDQAFISFDYGQKHVKELSSAGVIAAKLRCTHRVVDLKSVTPLLKGSALTDDKNVNMPEGFYAEENMRLTVVPNRNAMMLSIAWAAGIAEQADIVYYGAHAGDHYIYEDCRPEFVASLSHAFLLGTHGLKPSGIMAPFIEMDKAQILKVGLELKVPYESTWTCYKGRTVACGVCGSCQERLEAFAKAGIDDPLPYENRRLIPKRAEISA